MALSLTRPVISASVARSAMALSTRYLSTTTAAYAPKSHEKPLIETDMSFIRHNPPEPKPRTKGLTEIRAAYYTVMGPNYLRDVLETMGSWVDGLKFAGGSFTLFPEHKLREVIDLAHEHGVYVSTGGFAEHLLLHPKPVATIEKYLVKCKDLGFDVIELSKGFLSLPGDDWIRLVETVQKHNLEPKPELGIAFGAGGDTEGIEATSDPSGLISQAKTFSEMGVKKMMVESEGITENVGDDWRTDVVTKIARELPMEKMMFEAADPKVFTWYIREFGKDVNLFVDHSQIVQLTGLRCGIWGTSDTFGRIASFRPDLEK